MSSISQRFPHPAEPNPKRSAWALCRRTDSGLSSRSIFGGRPQPRIQPGRRRQPHTPGLRRELNGREGSRSDEAAGSGGSPRARKEPPLGRCQSATPPTPVVSSVAPGGAEPRQVTHAPSRRLCLDRRPRRRQDCGTNWAAGPRSSRSETSPATCDRFGEAGDPMGNLSHLAARQAIHNRYVPPTAALRRPLTCVSCSLRSSATGPRTATS